MHTKWFRLGLLSLLLVLLAGCQTAPAGGSLNIFLQEGGKLTPSGTGWEPGHVIRFWVYDAPVSDSDSPGGYSCVTAPQELKFDPENPPITVDSYGQFGQTGNSRYWLVQNRICGVTPAQKCKTRIQAQDQSTQASTVTGVVEAPWFTFKPC
jgi:hypothetical protein